MDVSYRLFSQPDRCDPGPASGNGIEESRHSGWCESFSISLWGDSLR